MLTRNRKRKLADHPPPREKLVDQPPPREKLVDQPPREEETVMSLVDFMRIWQTSNNYVPATDAMEDAKRFHRYKRLLEMTEPGLEAVTQGHDGPAQLMHRVLCSTVDSSVLWRIIDVDDGVEAWRRLENAAGFVTEEAARWASKQALQRITWYDCGGSIARLVEDVSWHARVLAGRLPPPRMRSSPSFAEP